LELLSFFHQNFKAYIITGFVTRVKRLVRATGVALTPNPSGAKNYAIFKYDRKYSIVHNQDTCISIAGQESTQCLVYQVVLLLLGKYLIIVVIKWKTKKYHSMGVTLTPYPSGALEFSPVLVGFMKHEL
jgi:hypothetical protein